MGTLLKQAASSANLPNSEKPHNRIGDAEAHRRAELAQKLYELSQRCLEAAEHVRERRRLERIAAISEWCVEQAERLADDRFGDGKRPDLQADVISVAWELGKLAEGKWPPSLVIRMAKRRVRGGRVFEVTTTIEDHCPERREHGLDLDIFPDQRRPDRIVCFRLDLTDWLARLSDVPNKIAVMLAAGDCPAAVSVQMNIDPAVVSKWRSWLMRNWNDFHNSALN